MTALNTQSILAQRQAGGFEVVLENSLASAMMLALIDENNVMIIDKAENNPTKLDNGKPVWGSVMSLSDNTARGLDMITNPFCAAGATLGNGTWMVAGGNQAIGYGGGALNVAGQPTVTPAQGPYQDYDGRLAIRLMDPTNGNSGNIAWQDNSTFMKTPRWYPGIEVMTDGSVLLIGGMTGGGYINRNYPNQDPAFEGAAAPQALAGNTWAAVSNQINSGGSNPTWEFFPDKGFPPQIMTFMQNTSGLNTYPHTYLMPSGKLFMQANYSTALWNPYANDETKAYNLLDDMPDQIVRVYPASGATAMLPLTPENNYTPTILFCGGTIMTDQQWGSYTSPLDSLNLYTHAAQKDCSSITPEDANGNLVSGSYTREEELPEPRTMGQFIHLPTGQMVIVNGAQMGTAGYGNMSWNKINGVNFEGLSNNPTYQPVLYDPEKPMGSRLSRDGFGISNIARLYHSSAILLPDGSVLIGGSNPHQDVSINMPANTSPQAFNTTYEMEKWYPPYFFETRPEPTGLPSYILYGGATWNFTMPASYMGSSANYKANNTKVMVIRPGFSTHAMNMGQRSMRLQHTYTVNDDGSVMYMVNPMPTNQNLFVQGPALLFITIDGIPSSGKFIQVGTQKQGGQIPNTITAGAAPKVLPQGINNSKYDAIPEGHGIESFGLGKLIGIIVAGVAVIALLLLGLICWRRRARRGQTTKAAAPASGAIYGMGGYTTNGPEYKRVHTPSNTPFQTFAGPGRGSTGTFDTYKMNDVSAANTPYYDNPPRLGTPQNGMPRSPLMHETASLHSTTQGQGWGEHQAQGDVGEQYYNNSAYSDPSRYYETPGQQHMSYHSSQSYGGGPRPDSQSYFRAN
ncbi:DUF1929-domain-containing protein [Meira miltonrushii]|uniref:DUF1929-domain-containing protein n=1 Tax=Meira miltonrushii TaxID=1280837 RepID=A0A316VK50_9BASI|nr:DUF1929-domain-containing protein [Meira miltonrushii]PWN36401.1 DUF1929-domain-containing protein [Meira miltonrushii]